MKAKTLFGFLGILILLLTGAVLAQSESQAISLANEAKTILDSAKSKDDYHRGAQKYEAALKIFQRVKSDKGTDICSNELGIIQYRLGQYQKALDYFEQSLVIRKKIGDIKGEGLSLNNIAAIC